jgi:hypothetical protein
MVKLSFNFKLVLFLILLEIFTIPFVAIANTLVLNNVLLIAVLGFVVAFFAIAAIIRIITQPLKMFISSQINQPVCKLTGVFYTSLLSGILLMLMFYIQTIIYLYTNNSYIIGTLSAFFSVGPTLLIYFIIEKYFKIGIKIITPTNNFLISIKFIDIVYLTLLFSLYETFASPLSIIWLTHTSDRFFWGILSGLAAGLGGSIPIVIICRLFKYKLPLYLIK